MTQAGQPKSLQMNLRRAPVAVALLTSTSTDAGQSEMRKALEQKYRSKGKHQHSGCVSVACTSNSSQSKKASAIRLDAALGAWYVVAAAFGARSQLNPAGALPSLADHWGGWSGLPSAGSAHQRQELARATSQRKVRKCRMLGSQHDGEGLVCA